MARYSRGEKSVIGGVFRAATNARDDLDDDGSVSLLERIHNVVGSRRVLGILKMFENHLGEPRFTLDGLVEHLGDRDIHLGLPSALAIFVDGHLLARGFL